jgi:transcriptional regulator with XRE-family HTH domain
MESEAPRTRDRTPFGQRVRAARKHAGLTQDELGARTGLGQSGIAYLETKGMASEKTWLIAQVCGVSAAWLADETGSMLSSGPVDADVMSETLAGAIPPSSRTDYQAIAHTLAKSLEETGVSLTVKQFLALADGIYKKLRRP